MLADGWTSLLPADWLQIAALGLLLAALWFRRFPQRPATLWISALTSLLLGVWGVTHDRWQAGIGAALALLFLLMLGVGLRRKEPLGKKSRIAVNGSALLGVALAVFLLVQFPVGPLPAPTGPFAVGVRDFDLTDATRRGVLNVAADAPRRLLVRVWYPATPAPDAQPRPYFSAREAQTTARSFGEMMGFPPLITYFRHATTHSYENAPLRTDGGKLPVIFYHHGYSAFAGGNTALMEDLASHGYVIYAVQHTGDASATVFTDGSVIPLDPKMITHLQHFMTQGFPDFLKRSFTADAIDQRFVNHLRVLHEMPQLGNDPARGYAVSPQIWVADQLFVHDALQAGKVPENVKDLLAASALDHAGQLGISYGGSTAAAVCIEDKRCAAAVNLDGGDFHLAGFARDIPVPFLMFHADLRGMYQLMEVEPKEPLHSYNDFSYEHPAHAGQRADIYRMQLLDAAHAGLSDNSLFMNRPIGTALNGSAPSEVLIGATNAFVRGFFDHHLRGIDNGFPQAQYAEYADWVKPYDNSSVREWWLAKSPAQRTQLQQRIDTAR